VPEPASECRHAFISYSHADRARVERLRRMMAPLLRGSGQELRLWDDSSIEAGGGAGAMLRGHHASPHRSTTV